MYKGNISDSLFVTCANINGKWKDPRTKKGIYPETASHQVHVHSTEHHENPQQTSTSAKKLIAASEIVLAETSTLTYIQISQCDTRERNSHSLQYNT